MDRTNCLQGKSLSDKAMNQSGKLIQDRHDVLSTKHQRDPGPVWALWCRVHNHPLMELQRVIKSQGLQLY